jgi:hypothetical protein
MCGAILEDMINSDSIMFFHLVLLIVIVLVLPHPFVIPFRNPIE